MPKDNPDILEVLKFELDFINSGGYGRSVRTPQKPTLVFRDSPSCLNFGDSHNTHPCRDCLLMEFVPPSARAKGLPCHQIPMGPQGETIDKLLERDDQGVLEEAVRSWIETRISRIEDSRAQLAKAPKAPSPGQREPEHRQQVLVVDDDESVLSLLDQLLEEAGYETTTAWGGREAVEILRQSAFDLVLLDDYLPDLPSEEVLRQLRRLTDSTLVIVMQSGTLPDELAVRYARLGVRFFTDKHEPERIVELVRDSLSRCSLLVAHY
jgi:CheY-like chemotaxis protein